MHSDIINEDEKRSNHSPVIMLLCLPYTQEGDYIRINKAVTTCGGINPYTLTARLGPGGLAHYETSSRLDPTARSFAQGNKTWRSSRILVS